MIPIRLEIENFLSYQRLATLDLAGYELACIAGENGAGKSSLLDAITWVLFGRCRAPGRDDVVNRLAARLNEPARVQLDFELEGALYRVMRVQEPGKTGLLEFQLSAGPDQWKPLTEATLSATQSRLEELLRMNYETFTNASFLLQGHADEFTVKRPGERKRILGDLLGVSHWELYREEATRRRRDSENELATAEGRLAEIESDLEQEPERRKHLETARADHEAARQQRATQEELAQTIRAYESAVGLQRTLIRGLESNLEQATATLQRQEQTRRARQAEWKTYQEMISQAAGIERQYGEWQEATGDLRAWEEKAARWNEVKSDHQQAVHEVDRKRSRLEQELSSLGKQQQELEERRRQRPEIETRLAKLLEQEQALRQQLQERETIQEELGRLQSAAGVLEGRQPQLKREMQRMKGRLTQLQADEGGRCPLCDQDLSAEHRSELVRQIEEEGRLLGDQYRQNDTDLKRLHDELNQARNRLQALAAIERSLGSVKETEYPLRSQLEQIEQATARWQELGAPRLAEIGKMLAKNEIDGPGQARIAALADQLAGIGYDLERHRTARERVETLSDAQAAYQRLQQARAAVESLEITLNDLDGQLEEQRSHVGALTVQCEEAREQLSALGPAPGMSLAEAEHKLSLLREAEVMASKAVGAAEQALAALEIQRRQQEELKKERQAITQRISQLKILERAFGRNGVQALLIEQALPAIEDSANEILGRLTANEMQVHFSTQRKLKSRDAMAETLDIGISDTIGDRPYEMYSGGEAFRANFAIRIALSKLLAQRAGARLRTLVIDEGFGSQDPEGRRLLIEAINSIRGDFAKILVITHIDELKEAFPTRIQVSKDPHGSHLEII
jgi:exonuclease SbcC